MHLSGYRVWQRNPKLQQLKVGRNVFQSYLRCSSRQPRALLSRAGLMGIWPMQLYRALTQKGPKFGLILSYCHLAILKNVIFELMFVSKVQWDSGTYKLAEKCTACMCVSHFLPPHLHIVLAMLYECTIPVWPWCVGVQGDSKWVQVKCVKSMTEGEQGGQAFHLNQNLTPIQKEDSDIVRYTNDWGSLSHPFFLVLLPCISQPRTRKIMMQKGTPFL